MGWLEGLLTGYADRHYQIQKDKMREAEQAAEREGRVFETLMNSKYKDIQQYAMAGVLDLSSPRKRKGGVAGWMGDVEQTPYLDMIRRTQSKIDADPEFAESNLRDDYGADTGPREQGGTPPPTPSIPTAAGSVAPPAPGTPPAAQVATSLVTGGPGTPATPAPTSQAGAPPQPPTPVTASELAGAPGAPPMPLAASPRPDAAGPPPTPGQVSRGLPGATTQAVGAMAPVPRSRTQLPGIFPTASETALDAARARAAGADLGEQDSYIRVALAQGLTRADGLKMWAAAQQSRLSSGTYSTFNVEYVDPVSHEVTRKLARVSSRTGQLEDMLGNPLPADARRIGQQRTPDEAYAIARATQMGRDTLRWTDAVQRAVTAYPGVPLDDILKAAEAFYQSKPPGSLPPTMPTAAKPPVPPDTPVDPNAPPVNAPPVDPNAPPVAPPVTPPAESPADKVRKELEKTNPELLTVPRRPATDVERKDLQYAERMQEALDFLRTPDKQGRTLEDRVLQQSLLGQSWGKYGPYPTLTDDQKLYRLAMTRFAEARLRLESGMLIRPEEYDADTKMYFVAPGENAVTLASKRAARDVLLSGRYHEAGPAYFEKYRRQYQPAWNPNAAPQTPNPNPTTPAVPGGTGTYWDAKAGRFVTPAKP
jgi:hypothetical protein